MHCENYVDPFRLVTNDRITMGKVFFTIIVLIIAAYAIEAYAFGGRYRVEAMQQGKRFSYDVNYQLKRIGF